MSRGRTYLLRSEPRVVVAKARLEDELTAIYMDGLQKIKRAVGNCCGNEHAASEYVNAPARKKRAILTPSDSSEEDESSHDRDEHLPFLHKDTCLLPRTLFSSTDASIQEETLSYSHVDGSESTVLEKRTAIAPKQQITLCDKSILLFTGVDNEQVKKDVTNCVLLAQLHADKQVQLAKEKEKDSFTKIDAIKLWCRYYEETFSHLAWMRISSNVEEMKLTGKDVQMDDILVDIVASIATSEEDKTAIAKAVKALKSLPNEDGRIQLFKNRTANKDLVQVVVSVVYIDSSGSASLSTSAVGISTDESVTNVLWFRWSDGKAKMFKSDVKLMLGSGVYEHTRPVVEKKLAAINASYIDVVPF